MNAWHVVYFLEALAELEGLAILLLAAVVACLALDPAAIALVRKRTSARLKALVGVKP